MQEDQLAEYGIIIPETGMIFFFFLFIIINSRRFRDKKIKKNHNTTVYVFHDRSTPRVDSYWGGKNDLIAAVGYEKDGVTTIAFRRKLKGDYHV